MQLTFKNLSTLLLLFMITGILPLSVAHAEPQSGTARNITATMVTESANPVITSNVSQTADGYVNRIFPGPVNLQGTDQTYEFFYLVPKARLGDQNYMELHYRHSELVMDRQSSLTVVIDNEPLKSFSLRSNSASGQVRIPLSGTALTPGFHQVTMMKHDKFTDAVCEDPDDPSNWLELSASSYIFIDTKETWNHSDLLNQYPFPYIEQGTPAEVYGAVIVPDSPDPGIIEAALEVTSYLSAKTASKQAVPIMTESEWLKGRNFMHVIAIGALGDWKSSIQRILLQGNMQHKEDELGLHHFLVEDTDTHETKQLMLVSANNSEVIANKIGVIADDDLVRQLAGNQLTVSGAQLQKGFDELKKKLDLSSFGYDSILLQGDEKVTNYYYFSLPTYWDITGESYLELHVKISPLLAGQTVVKQPAAQDAKTIGSSRHGYGLTLKINGVPYSISLGTLIEAPLDGELHLVKVPISSILKNMESSTLSIVFEANIQDESLCHPNESNGEWIYIDKSSHFHIPHQEVQKADVQFWPGPFASDEGAGVTTILLPSKINGTILSLLSEITKDLVPDPRGHMPNVLLDDGSGRIAETAADQHIIAVGDLNQLPSVTNMGEKLLIGWDSGELNLAKYNVINETTGSLVWVQSSPWNNTKSLAVFPLHPDKKEQLSLTKMLQYLKDDRKPGQIVVMSRSGELFTLNLHSEFSAVALSSNGDTAKDHAPIPLWLLIVVSCVFLTLAIAFFWAWKRGRRG